MLIARYCEKICHCDWRNKKLSGQRLARRYSRDFWISGKKGGEGASRTKRGAIWAGRDEGRHGEEPEDY